MCTQTMAVRRRAGFSPPTRPRRSWWLSIALLLGGVAFLPLFLVRLRVFSAGRGVPGAPFSAGPGWWVQAGSNVGTEKDLAAAAAGHTKSGPGAGVGIASSKASRDHAKDIVQHVIGHVPPPVDAPADAMGTGSSKHTSSAQDYFVVHTHLGNITMKFRSDKAPKHVEYMKTLIQQKKYDGMCWYRAEKNFVLQGGLRNAAGRVFPSSLPSPPLEYHLTNRRGFVNMARWDDPNSAGGDFCILLKDSPHLDRQGQSTSGYAAGFTVWAEVTEGMDVADRISDGPAKSVGGLNFLKDAVSFESVTIV